MTTAAPVLPSGAALQQRLRALAAQVFELPVERVGFDAPLARLGLDSVNAAELTALIEDDLDIELSPTVLFDCPTLGDVADYIESRGRTGALAEPPVNLRLARMRNDAVLPPDVAPHWAPATDTGRVLVTGATGFVGAYLLRELLTASRAEVYCLVRGESGDERVRANLERYRLWDDSFASRIRCLCADIERPSLGLPQPAYAELAAGIDVVYHAAAAVDWVQPYEALRDANVVGTIELLRLACTGKPKRFSFLSSLAVCYSTVGPDEVDESADPLALLAGLHLGYAQSKSVAESLVHEAARRGLPATVVRPALVAGDSHTGASNVDDLVSLFFRGCIALGAAPDLDWAMDSVPVDYVARAITSATAESPEGNVVHLVNPEPRRWRECVLWMRLRGYPLALLPYDDWAEMVRRRATDASHPLHGLRWFLLHRVAEEGGLAVPQLYEETRRHRARADRSMDLLDRRGIACPPLDARLLGRFFDWYAERNVIPSPSATTGAAPRRQPGGVSDTIDRIRATIEDGVSRESGSRACVVDLELSRFGRDSSIIAELTSWRRGTTAGVYRASVTIDVDGHRRRPMDVVVKVKTPDEDTLEVGSHVATLCNPSLGAAYDRFRDHVGFRRGHVREIAIARMTDPALAAHSPRVIGAWQDDERGEWGTVVELVSDAVVKDADDRPWTDTEIDVAMNGLAALHGTWLGRTGQLATRDWLPPLRDGNTMRAMTPLWTALAENAAPLVDKWCGAASVARHRGLANATSDRPEAPRTLIHNDFNPRNIMLRGGGAGGGMRLCAYDWELATVGMPQRDLVELLAFALDPATAADRFLPWVERYRSLLAGISGVELEPALWRAGVRAALDELLIDRLAMYAMVHRFRPQRFLPRVFRTWMRIDAAMAPVG